MARVVRISNVGLGQPRTKEDLGLQLLSAAQRGRSSEVKRLLAAGAAVSRDMNGLTALHKVAKQGHVRIVKQLLASKKFDVNAQDKYGWTPLHWSSWCGQINTIHALLADNKCIVNAVDRFVPLRRGKSLHKEQTAPDLFFIHSGSNSVHCAAINGHLGVVRVLAPVKCNLNQQRKDGWTPLHLASWNGHQDMVHELIEAKCKVNVRTRDGMGALHLAAYKGYSEIAQELLDAGVAPDMQDKHGNTAMHEAAKGRRQKMIKLLMSSDCRINMRNMENETPIDIARKEGYSEIVMEMSGLGYRECNCHEIKRILFQDKDVIQKCDDVNKLKLNQETSDESNVLNHLRERLKDDTTEQSWQEKLEQARAEVLARCESRIAQVERHCQDKVAKMERQCSRQLEVARSVLGDSFDSSLASSALETNSLEVFSSSSSISSL